MCFMDWVRTVFLNRSCLNLLMELVGRLAWLNSAVGYKGGGQLN